MGCVLLLLYCYWTLFKHEQDFWWGQLMQVRGASPSRMGCLWSQLFPGNAKRVVSFWGRSRMGSISIWVSVYQTSTNCPEPGRREEWIGEIWAVEHGRLTHQYHPSTVDIHTVSFTRPAFSDLNAGFLTCPVSSELVEWLGRGSLNKNVHSSKAC